MSMIEDNAAVDASPSEADAGPAAAWARGAGAPSRAGAGASPAHHAELLALFQRQRLTPVQRRIAHYLLEHPDETVFLGASELGERAGVSQPSVSRFAQSLGFDGYPEFVQHLRKLHAAHQADPPDAAHIRNRLQDAVADEIRNLQTLEREFAQDGAVAELGRELAASEPLVIVGLRASANVAGSFAFFAAKVHPDVRLITAGGSQARDTLMQARDTGALWVMAFALPRVPRETVELLAEARSTGYRVACVASEALGPVSEVADVSLRAPVATRLVFDSQAAPVVMAAALVDAVAEADPARTQRRLEAFEQQAAAHRYYEF